MLILTYEIFSKVMINFLDFSNFIFLSHFKVFIINRNIQLFFMILLVSLIYQFYILKLNCHFKKLNNIFIKRVKTNFFGSYSFFLAKL